MNGVISSKVSAHARIDSQQARTLWTPVGLALNFLSFLATVPQEVSLLLGHLTLPNPEAASGQREFFS